MQLPADLVSWRTVLTAIFPCSRLTDKVATDEPIEEQGPFRNSRSELTPEDSSESLYMKCTISGDSIAEECEDDEMVVDKPSEFKRPSASTGASEGKYVWRVNLFKSEPYWKSWFENLSKLFLSAPSNGRLLLLAGIDRLDKDLTIGQMQGKCRPLGASPLRYANSNGSSSVSSVRQIPDAGTSSVRPRSARRSAGQSGRGNLHLSDSK